MNGKLGIDSLCGDCWWCLSRPDEKVLHELDRFAQHIGLAFQIRDDLLDATSTTEELGKVVVEMTSWRKVPILLYLA